jgi:peptidoglycan/LPS O-acetylase OafA/YrhL
LYGIPITLFILGLGALEQNDSNNGLLKVLIHPWFIWLGATSYVMYLIHNMVLRIWDTLIPITPMQMPLITIAVIGASAIGYQLWEKPVLAYVYKKVYRPSK